MVEVVYLSTKNINLHSRRLDGKKLQPQFIGPFKIMSQVNPATYRLDLPSSLKRIHPEFHVEYLLPYIPPCPYTTPTPAPRYDPVLVNGEEHYYIDKLLDRRKYYKNWYILVQWLGYPVEEATWVLESELKKDSPSIVSEFLATR